MISDVLVLIPENEVLNLIASTSIFVLIAHEVHNITNDLIPVLVQPNGDHFIRNLTPIIVIIFLLISSENFKDLNF